MTFVAWNVRRINDLIKTQPIRDLIKKYNGEVICLIETRLQDTTPMKVASLWGTIAHQFIARNAHNNVVGESL